MKDIVSLPLEQCKQRLKTIPLAMEEMGGNRIHIYEVSRYGSAASSIYFVVELTSLGRNSTQIETHEAINWGAITAVSSLYGLLAIMLIVTQSTNWLTLIGVAVLMVGYLALTVRAEKRRMNKAVRKALEG